MTDMIQGEKPSEEELFYKRWGWETLKENISILNDVLKLFIVVDSAILSAYLGFYGKFTIYPWIKIVLFILLIISLCSSIVGIYPFSMKVNLNKPQEIKILKLKRVKFKGQCLVIAPVTLIVGFVALLIAILIAC